MARTENQKALIEKLRPAASSDNCTVSMCARQIWDICRSNDDWCKIVAEDLDNPEMSVQKCEDTIREAANKKHKKLGGNGAAISPDEAENIIRKFYGLPERELPEDPFAESEETATEQPADTGPAFTGVYLEDFL